MTASNGLAHQISRRPIPASSEQQQQQQQQPATEWPAPKEEQEAEALSSRPDMSPAQDKNLQLSSSHATARRPRSSVRGAAFTAWLDRRLPPHRRYCRLRRRTFLIVLAALVLALLALIIGLAVGLTERANSNSLFLPLPSSTQHFTGDLTYYGTGLGACGVTSSASDDIVSVSHYLFDAEQGSATDPNNNPLCGLVIRAERFDAQVGANRSVDLTVVDRCVGCQPTDLDVSTGAFQQLADMDRGRVPVTWAWLSPEPTAATATPVAGS